MPASRPVPWLICYDIADPGRLRDVHKEVRRYATPFQYSVFRTTATRREVVARLDVLADAIDPRSDDVRAYPLLTNAPQDIYGTPRLADGARLDDQAELLFENSLWKLAAKGWER